MMSLGHKILVALYLIVFIGLAGFSSYLLAEHIYEEEHGVPSEVKFILDEEIDLVVGAKYQLTPYIINEDDIVEYGQYIYKANSNSISVSDTGVITVNNLATEDVFVTVTELERNLSKNVKVNITKGINGVFDISAETNSLDYNGVYAYEVTFLPQDADITDFVSYKTVDEAGKEISDVLTLEVEKNKLNFKAIGLGKGKLIVNINSEKDMVDYTKEFIIDISLPNKVLTEAVTQGRLLSSTDILEIDTLYYSGTSLNVRDLDVLPNLTDVVLENETEICICENFNYKLYNYHVKSNLYSAYFEAIGLGNSFFDYVEPYEELINDKFVIYNDTRDDSVSCERVFEHYSFPTLTQTGYIHKGWSIDETINNIVSTTDIHASNDNSIVLYSIFEPINYSLIFKSTYKSDYEVIDVYNYEAKVMIEKSNFAELINTSYPGYKFVGWSLDVSKTTILRPEDFDSIELFNLLDNETITIEEPMTDVDGTNFVYYDVWQPIEYSVEFSTAGYGNEFKNVNISLYKTYYYDDSVLIDGFEVIGYNLNGWNHNGEVINKIEKLTTVENEVVVLTPNLSAKEYNIWIRIPKVVDGERKLNVTSTEYEDYVGTIKYDEDLFASSLWYPADSNGLSSSSVTTKISNLPVKIGTGYADYSWYIDLEGGTQNVLDKNEPRCTSSLNGVIRTSLSIKDFMIYSSLNLLSALNNYTENSIFALRIEGVSEQFTVEFDLSEGKPYNTSGVGITLNSGKYSTTDTINVGYVTKTGYTHIGWEIKVGNTNAMPYDGQKLSIKSGSIYIDDINLDELTITKNSYIIIKARYSPNQYTLTIDSLGGSTGVYTETVTYGEKYGNILPTPTKAHNEFKYWYYFDGVKETIITSESIVNIADNHKINAKWETVEFVVTISTSNTSVTVKNGSTTVTSGSYVRAGSSLTVSFTANDGYQNATCTFNGASISSGSSNTMPSKDIIISASSTAIPQEEPGSCLAAGTQIMLAAGTTRAVEDIREGDLILAFDHLSGRFVETRVGFTYYDYSEVAVLNLKFTNDVEITLLNDGHGMFDVTLGKYILLGPNNVSDLIGHKFVYVDFVNGNFVTKTVELLSFELTVEMVQRFDIVTEGNINHIANGLLACSDLLVGFSNLFEFDGLLYDEEKMLSDIEEYGLYSYDEWSEFVTCEEFEAFNGGYFKIAVEKGLITLEEIYELIYWLVIFENPLE